MTLGEAVDVLRKTDLCVGGTAISTTNQDTYLELCEHYDKIPRRSNIIGSVVSWWSFKYGDKEFILYTSRPDEFRALLGEEE